jgi:hypothetical protein
VKNLWDVCRLCDKEANLEESHVVPSFVYKWLKDTSGTGFLRFGIAPNKRVQDGYKLFWLCADCEDRLNAWETKFANHVFHPFNKGDTARGAYESWLLKFCVSVSWRVLHFFIEEVDLNHFPAQLQANARRAHAIWKEFLLDRRFHPERHEQHFLPLDTIESFIHPGMPPNINRYILRTVDIDAVWGGKDAFIYSKIGRFVIVGFLNMHRPKEWQGTKVHVQGGILKSQTYTLPVQFGEYFIAQARKFAEVQARISERQNKKIEESFWENIDRVADSESFRAMDHDVRLFGKDAFKKNSE